MSTPHALLGLMEAEPSHGYTLKQSYDDYFGAGRPLRFGQVYSTLARLQREGWAESVGVQAGSGPDRKLYAITAAGVAELEQWLSEPEADTGRTRNTLFTKVVLALISGRSPHQILDQQRVVHVARMRELTRSRNSDDVLGWLAADFEIAHLEADLRWIELAADKAQAAAEQVAP